MPGSSPTLGSLGPNHHRRHKSRVSLRGPLWAHGVLGTPYGEVRNIKPLKQGLEIPCLAMTWLRFCQKNTEHHCLWIGSPNKQWS